MKKVLFILLACLFVLGACSNSNNSGKTATQVDENKVQFKNDTLVLDQAVLKIKDTFLINDKESSNGKKLLAFKYEVKSKDGSENVTPINVWIASMEATQDDESTENKLEVGITPNTGKFEKWSEHSEDVIKKGKTSKGIMTYELDNDNQVTLKATQGADGKDLGNKKINISKLKTIDYSVTEDITSNGESNTKSIASVPGSKSFESLSDNEIKHDNSNDKQTQPKQSNQSQQTNLQQVSNQPTQSNNQVDNQPEPNGYHKVYNQVNPELVAHNDELSRQQTQAKIEYNKNFDPAKDDDLYNIETGSKVSEE
ncbi:DUF5067 domain-containing protein [Staphylococcus haemolyticus]|uniref:DUF5067 domain-containing protein n=1 Tax=Staphylococcus haemolyticus TaxID=1283 RepID=UPI001F0A07B3|nr:DUF5067 domain-containing protein [Staphylococcus haemolyticus]MCH4489281.1 DUF5067 domain-containing protein [Staphylococcus haemolyticus]